MGIDKVRSPFQTLGSKREKLCRHCQGSGLRPQGVGEKCQVGGLERNHNDDPTKIVIFGHDGTGTEMVREENKLWAHTTLLQIIGKGGKNKYIRFTKKTV